MLAPKIDDDYDIIINDKGNIEMLSGLDEIAQSIQILLSVNKGEWAFNIDFGLDYSAFIDESSNLEYIKAKILQALDTDERIIEVEEFDMEFIPETRTIKIDLKMRVQNGETEETLIISDIING
jgi:phage baseplate assembly protein W